jgi:hypothetical protein
MSARVVDPRVRVALVPHALLPPQHSPRPVRVERSSVRARQSAVPGAGPVKFAQQALLTAAAQSLRDAHAPTAQPLPQKMHQAPRTSHDTRSNLCQHRLPAGHVLAYHSHPWVAMADHSDWGFTRE